MTSQTTSQTTCYCPLDCQCRRVHRGVATFAPCGCTGDGSIAAPIPTYWSETLGRMVTIPD